MMRWQHLRRTLRSGFVVRKIQDIEPDEIFLDSSNLGEFDARQLEGRVVEPLSPLSVIAVGVVFALFAFGYSYRIFNLSVTHGAEFAEASEENRLEKSVVFGERGVIYDRNGKELAWNEAASSTASSSIPFSLRRYTDLSGVSHVLGYIRYPKADAQGEWWRTEYTPLAGIEKTFDDLLKPQNGEILREVDALGRQQHKEMLVPPKDGQSLTLSIDAEISDKLYDILAEHSRASGFRGAAAAIIDVKTGEVLALSSYPEYSAEVMAKGDAQIIDSYNKDTRMPFLDRAVAGAYTPGSIVKPLFALAALNEGVISAEKAIFSPGYITIPNPYHPDKPTIMKDWRAHGYTDMRHAIAVSSDVYFYSIGGGYQDQRGLGITKLDEWARKFGLGSTTGIKLPGEMAGVIPTPEWKKEVVGEAEWRLGDTYNTSIGQYGFQVTPIQMARYIAALANGGTLYEPHLVKGEAPSGVNLGIPESQIKVIREGMRLAVSTEGGTARALNMSGLSMAGKTGTAQLGVHNEWMNSWVVGFWPYENPRYAFAVLSEHAPAGTLSGSAPAMAPFFAWLVQEKPEYTQ